MVHHRFIIGASVVLVAWLAGATHAEDARPLPRAGRTVPRERVVLELSGLT